MAQLLVAELQQLLLSGPLAGHYLLASSGPQVLLALEVYFHHEMLHGAWLYSWEPCNARIVGWCTLRTCGPS